MSNARYTYGDIVKFKTAFKGTKEGVIAIVDAYGTFESPGKPSYDIYVKKENILFKHISESSVIEKIGSVPEEEIWK